MLNLELIIDIKLFTPTNLKPTIYEKNITLYGNVTIYLCS